MTSPSPFEDHALATVSQSLQEQGYSYDGPERRFTLPSGRSIIADHAYRRGDEILLVEFKSEKTSRIARLMEQLKKEIEKVPNAKFAYYFLDEFGQPSSIRGQSARDVANALTEVEVLMESEKYEIALLLLWSAFEATARQLHPKLFSKPMSSEFLVSNLASRGIIQPQDERRLRFISKKRNGFAHGDFRVMIDPSDLRFLAGIIETLLHREGKGSDVLPHTDE